MTERRSNWVNTLGGAAIILVAIAVIYVLASQFRPILPVERSALGFDGLAQLLEAQDRPARTFSGGSALATDGLGLRVLPLYVDSEDVEAVFSTMFLQGEAAYVLPPSRLVPSWVVTDKVEAAPTLIILPKWSDGVRLSGLAHPDFLLNNPDRPTVTARRSVTERANATDPEAADETGPEDDSPGPEGSPDSEESPRDALDLAVELEIDALPNPVVLPEVILTSTDTRQRVEVNTRFGDIALRAPQYVRVPDPCRALIGDAERALVIECSHTDTAPPYWVLSDPDVLNNHGLHNGRNAQTALTLMDRLSTGGDIVIDYSTQVWAEGGDDRRTIAELLRYFAPPFAWIWIAAGLLFGLAWWRGAVRDRPVVSVFDHGHRGARSTVMSAQARLMRNTGRDGALLRVLAHQRVLSLCERLLGRDDRTSNRQSRMLAFVERRNPDLAHRLTSVLEDTQAVPDRLAPGAAIALLTRLETAYEEARQLA